jgi:hypothetical protein
LHNQENRKKANQDRKKRLRLPTPPLPDTADTGSQEDDQVDSDFDPEHGADSGSDDDIGPDVVAANVVNRKRGRPQPPAIRCSPKKFQSILKALTEDLKAQINSKGFGGLLGFKPKTLDRKLLTWLMQRLNPETMNLDLGAGKVVAVNEHSVWCLFQLPKVGCDPPTMTDAEARVKRNQLGQEICPDTYDATGIRISDIVDGLSTRRLGGILGLRAFFMALFQCLLFSNTDSHMRLEDVIYTEDLDNIGNINWCKAVVDNLSKAARLYRKDFAVKGINAPLTGCGIFLIVSVFCVSLQLLLIVFSL